MSDIVIRQIQSGAEALAEARVAVDAGEGCPFAVFAFHVRAGQLQLRRVTHEFPRDRVVTAARMLLESMEKDAVVAENLREAGALLPRAPQFGGQAAPVAAQDAIPAAGDSADLPDETPDTGESDAPATIAIPEPDLPARSADAPSTPESK